MNLLFVNTKHRTMYYAADPRRNTGFGGIIRHSLQTVFNRSCDSNLHRGESKDRRVRERTRLPVAQSTGLRSLCMQRYAPAGHEPRRLMKQWAVGSVQWAALWKLTGALAYARASACPRPGHLLRSDCPLPTAHCTLLFTLPTAHCPPHTALHGAIFMAGSLQPL